jgi:hypothetical protein
MDMREGGRGGVENKRLNNSGFRSLGRASGAGFGSGIGAGAVRWFFLNTEQSNAPSFVAALGLNMSLDRVH